MVNTTLLAAIKIGFNFDEFESDATLQEIHDSMMDFLNENSDKLQREEDECEVTTNGRTQHVSYNDFWSDGEIVDFSENWHKSPDHKVFHSEFLMIKEDGTPISMNLYYLVGQTEYNAPNGFYFDNKTKSHEKIED